MKIQCKECGSEFSGDDAQGLCPRCLASAAIGRRKQEPLQDPFQPGELFFGFEILGPIARGGNEHCLQGATVEA